MSLTLATADLGSDGDSDDGDFIPSIPRPKRQSNSKRPRPLESGSSNEDEDDDEDHSDSGDSVDDENDSGGLDKMNESAGVEEEDRVAKEAAERKQRALEAFRAMQAETTTPSTSKSSPTTGEAAGAENGIRTRGATMVEIRRPRQFAGETIYETVKLRVDDPEAIRYLGSSQDTSSSTNASNLISLTPATITTSTQLNSIKPVSTPMTVLEGTSSSSVQSPSQLQSPSQASTATLTSSLTSVTDSGPSRPKPMMSRKKPRQSLEAMSAALDKGKKMTTLEKSQLDWNNHMTANTALSDEVEAHRRSGGYLAQRDFLDRVNTRRAQAFDKDRDRKRSAR